MLNQLVLIGKIVELKDNILTLSVLREKESKEDIIPMVISDNIKENISNYCEKNSTVGVKGRMRSNEEGIYIMVDKVTFLSTRRGDSDND